MFNKNDISSISSLDVLNLAVKQIFLNQTDNENFWYHSNMLGWGQAINYIETTLTATATVSIPDAISHRAGKETILHIVSNKKIEALGFLPKISLEDGIDELLKGYEMLKIKRYSNI